MSLSFVLKNTWYPKYIPKNVKRFTIPGWKIQTINAGTAGKQLQLSRLSDNKPCEASFSELESKMTTRHRYINTMHMLGFKLVEDDGKQLVFQLHGS